LRNKGANMTGEVNLKMCQFGWRKSTKITRNMSISKKSTVVVLAKAPTTNGGELVPTMSAN